MDDLTPPTQGARPTQAAPQTQGAPPPADLPAAMAERARQVGHDLNNSLGVVSGRAELALMQIERGNTEKAQAGIQVILDQIDKMRALSDSLRELDRSS